MSLVEEITKARKSLRNVETRDCSSPAITEKIMQEQGSEEAEHYYLDLGMEQWLPLVSDLSFPTVSIPLSLEDAALLRKCYAHIHVSAENERVLPHELLERLAPLAAAISPLLARTTDGAFTKLSGRSPKDAPLHTSRLRSGLKAVLEKEISPVEDNLKLWRLFEVAMEIMVMMHGPTPGCSAHLCLIAAQKLCSKRTSD